MNLSENKIARVVTLCALYAAQGIPFGFVTYLLASYMADNGYGTDTIGKLTAISTLPWVIKWIWGPVIDRFTYRSMGRRRPWILFAQFFMVITIAAMLLVPDITKNLNLLFALVFVNNVFASMQDVSVDALAIEMLAENERGLVNGLMFGSASGGAAFSGIVLAKVMGAYGLRMAMAVQAAVLFMIIMLPLLLRERHGEKLLPWTKGQPMGVDPDESNMTTRQLLIHIKKAFSIRSAIMMLVLAIFVKIAIELHGVVGTVYYIQQMGWTDIEFSNTRGKIELFSLLGCVIGGFLADRIGHKRIAITTTILFGISYIAFALMPDLWANRLAVKVFFGAEGALYGALSVSLFAMCMDISLPVVAATQFTAYMAMMNFSATIGKYLADFFDKNMSYGQILIFWGLFQAVVVSVILIFIDPHQRKEMIANEQ